jgi:hypothetical protein
VIIYFAGSNNGSAAPEKVLKKASILLTYYEIWKRNDTPPERFLKHKQQKEKRRAKRLS